MHEVRFVNVPIILMSATMAPSAIPFFSQEYGLDRPLVIRGLTDRPEIRYDVLPAMDVPAAADLLHQLRHQHITNGDPGDRFFAFVFSLQKGRELARLSGLPFYHGESNDIEFPMTARQQVTMYTNWLDGNPPGLVATEALGAGTDHPHARFALILHPPPNLVVLIQLMGRLCRDGRPGFVYIIPSPAMPPPSSSNEVEALQGSLVMNKILYAMPNWPVNRKDRCIRLAILDGNDGVKLACYEIADAQLCRYCQEYAATLTPDEFEWLGSDAYSDNSPPPLRPLIIRDHAPSMSTPELKRRLNEQFGPLVAASAGRSYMESEDQSRRVRRYLAMLTYPYVDACGYCVVYDLLGMLDFTHKDFKHDIDACNNIRDRKGFFDLKSNIKYGPGAMICFSCHFPSLNNVLHGPFKRGDVHHPYRRFVLPMAWAVYQTPKLREPADWRL
ncbi:P-loop containing nucleoside triphosphate hydrolase protein [Schizophyllum fasciatum]